MPEPTFAVVFVVVWLCAAAYVFCVFKLSLRIQQLKREGRAADAPALQFGIDPAHPFEVFRSFGWLVTGRYAKLADVSATRWANIARILLFLVAPRMVGMFALVLSGIIVP